MVKFSSTQEIKEYNFSLKGSTEALNFIQNSKWVKLVEGISNYSVYTYSRKPVVDYFNQVEMKIEIIGDKWFGKIYWRLWEDSPNYVSGRLDGKDLFDEYGRKWGSILGNKYIDFRYYESWFTLKKIE